MSVTAPSEYLAAALIWSIRNRRAGQASPQDRKALDEMLLSSFQASLNDQRMDWALERLQEWNVLNVLHDRYAGEVLSFADVAGDIAGIRQQSKVIDDTWKIGSQWLRNVLSKNEFWADLDQEFGGVSGEESQAERDAERALSNVEVPASDRIVSLDHNQISDADAQVSELITELEKDNGDPENPSLRVRLLGQLRAGRELIRAGEFKAYLLYEVLIKALAELVDRYGNETIKALANALLGALVSKMLESP